MIKLNGTEDGCEKVLEEMHLLQQELEPKVQRLYDLSAVLSRSARRSSDDSAKAHLMYANACLRFSGMVLQGMKRNAVVDRALKRAQERSSLDTKVTVLPKAKPVARALSYVGAPTNDDFAELFGEVTNV